MKQFYNVLENNIDVQEEPPAQVTKRISEQTITDCWKPFTEVDFWQTKKTVLIRWREHLVSVLNRPFHIDKDDISRLPQVECNIQLDFTTVNEKKKKKMSSDKAPGSDAIPAETTKQKASQWQKNLQSCFSACIERRQPHRN